MSRRLANVQKICDWWLAGTLPGLRQLLALCRYRDKFCHQSFVKLKMGHDREYQFTPTV